MDVQNTNPWNKDNSTYELNIQKTNNNAQPKLAEEVPSSYAWTPEQRRLLVQTITKEFNTTLEVLSVRDFRTFRPSNHLITTVRKIHHLFPGRTKASVFKQIKNLFRSTRENPGKNIDEIIKKKHTFPFTDEEDILLIALAVKLKKNWIEVTQQYNQITMKSRNRTGFVLEYHFRNLLKGMIPKLSFQQNNTPFYNGKPVSALILTNKLVTVGEKSHPDDLFGTIYKKNNDDNEVGEEHPDDAFDIIYDDDDDNKVDEENPDDSFDIIDDDDKMHKDKKNKRLVWTGSQKNIFLETIADVKKIQKEDVTDLHPVLSPIDYQLISEELAKKGVKRWERPYSIKALQIQRSKLFPFTEEQDQFILKLACQYEQNWESVGLLFNDNFADKGVRKQAHLLAERYQKLKSSNS